MSNKRLIVWSILFLILGIKAFFEIENYSFRTKIEKIMTATENRINTKIGHKTLDLGNYQIHYYVSGKDDTDLIIFLHPAFSDHRAFDQQIDEFSKEYRVITIDLIGHGLSKAKKSKDKIDVSSKHIHDILKIEGYEKAHFVGVSMGTLIAQYFALNYPEKVQSMTALGGYDINKDNKEVEKAQNSANMSLLFRAIFSMKSFRKKAAELTCKSEKGRAFFYETASLYERKSILVMPGLQNIIKNRESIPLPYPTLVLTGEFDIDLAKEMAKKWHNELENSNYFMIKDAGHCANIDKPLEFNDIVLKFIHRNS